MSNPEPLVRREDQGPVAVLIMNRPDQRNALSRALMAELSDMLDAIRSESRVRAVVLAAEGKAFCAGMDLKEATETGVASSMESSKSSVDDTQAIADLIDRVHKFPRPVVAAVQGDALGGGAGLALACDLVVMADSARIGYPEVRRGVVAAMVMHDLVRQVGDRRAREILLTGRPIDCEQALTWGLVNRVEPAERCRAEAIALAREFVACAPIALATTKHLLDEATNRPRDLRGAAAISAAIRDSDEAREGMLAFVEKREPQWKLTPASLPSYGDRDEGIDPDLPTGEK